ncbi:7215_t:CDS:2, partial [Ambispora leptoticha]
TPVLKYSVANDKTFTILTAFKQAESYNLNLNLGDIISLGIEDTITQEVNFQTTLDQSHTESSDSEKFCNLYNTSSSKTQILFSSSEGKILDHYLMFKAVQEIVNNVSSIDPSQITVYKKDSTDVNFTAKGIVQVVYGYNSTIEAKKD